MKRLLPNCFNLLLVICLGLGLSGCVTTRLPFAVNSPWQVVELDPSSNPLDIAFIDSGHGFLVGSSRLILETNDGGNSWDKRILELPSEENFRLISIDFQGDEGWLVGQPGLLMRSTDAGKNWTRLDLGSQLPGEPYLISALDSSSAELATTAGAIYRTNNGGETWEGKVSEASGGIRDIRRGNNGGYVSVSSLGNFFATLDPGQEMWQPHQRASSKRVQSVGYQPNGELWMVSRGAEIRFNEEPGDLDSWSKAITPIINGYNYLDLAWDPQGSIWAAGGNGTLLVSKDGGDQWEVDPVGDRQPSNLIRILFDPSSTDKPHGFVLGERGTLLRWVG